VKYKGYSTVISGMLKINKRGSTILFMTSSIGEYEDVCSILWLRERLLGMVEG
jgi:hypothetical protein